MPLCDPPDAAYDEFAGDLSYFFLHPRLVNIRYQSRLFELARGGTSPTPHPKKDRWDPISIPHVKKQEVFGQVAGVYRPDLEEG